MNQQELFNYDKFKIKLRCLWLCFKYINDAIGNLESPIMYIRTYTTVVRIAVSAENHMQIN